MALYKLIINNLNEIVALITSVVIGTGAYIGVVNLKKRDKINISFITSVLFINLFVTYVLSEFLKSKNVGEIRAYSLPLVAFGGQYLIDWIDRRYLKIFDAGAKKMGLDINKDNNETNETNENNENRDSE